MREESISPIMSSTTPGLDFLEHAVFPICHYVLRDNMAWVTRLQGTGFFLSRHGVFMTARHVLEAGMRDAGDEMLGICPFIAATDLKVVASIDEARA
jgi:hypothetical protein